MSKYKKIIEDLIEDIESSVKKGFKKEEFIRKFREKIDNLVAERIS